MNKLVSRLKEEKRDLVAQLDETRDQIAELSAKTSRLHCDNRSLKKEITSTIKNSMEDELKKQATRKDVFMREIEQLKTHLMILKDTKKDDEDEMKDEIRELQYKYQSAKANVEELQRHIKYRGEKEQHLREEIEMLKDNVHDKKAEILKVKDELVSRCESSNQRILELEHQLQSKEDKNQTLLETNQMLHNKLMYVNNGLTNGATAKENSTFFIW